MLVRGDQATQHLGGSLEQRLRLGIGNLRHVLPTFVGDAHAKLTPHLFTDQPRQPLAVTEQGTRYLAIPWALLALLGLIALLLVARHLHRRRRPRRPPRHASRRRAAGSGPDGRTPQPAAQEARS